MTGLARVMDEEDGDVVVTLQLAEVREHRRDFVGRVLIATMEADERVEDEQPGAQSCHGCP